MKEEVGEGRRARKKRKRGRNRRSFDMVGGEKRKRKKEDLRLFLISKRINMEKS